MRRTQPARRPVGGLARPAALSSAKRAQQQGAAQQRGGSVRARSSLDVDGLLRVARLAAAARTARRRNRPDSSDDSSAGSSDSDTDSTSSGDDESEIVVVSETTTTTTTICPNFARPRIRITVTEEIEYVSAQPRPVIPPQDARRFRPNGLVVVVDLDETVVFARDGPVLLRPYARDLATTLQSSGAEVIVWTAAARPYALECLRAFGGCQFWHHLVTRESRAWGYIEDEDLPMVKDIRQLGRPMDRILVVENSPASVRAHPGNAVLVQDFRGAEGIDDRSLQIVSSIVAAAAACSDSVPHVLTRCTSLESSIFYLPNHRVHTHCLIYAPSGTLRSYGAIV